MKSEDEIKKYVYDQYLLVEEIEKFPHTYKTLLTNGCCKDKTLQMILRRKLSTLHKDGIICKTNIPGTRFGEVIYYSFKRKYKIVIEDNRVDINVYCFFQGDYEKLSKFYISVKKYYLLNHCIWEEKNQEKTLFEGNILKWI